MIDIDPKKFVKMVDDATKKLDQAPPAQKKQYVPPSKGDNDEKNTPPY